MFVKENPARKKINFKSNFKLKFNFKFKFNFKLNFKFNFKFNLKLTFKFKVIMNETNEPPLKKNYNFLNLI